MASKGHRKSKSVQRTLAERMNEEVEEDEKSVYSVDPLMYEKLGIRKPKKGEEVNNLDAEKIVSFQLDKDLPKIVAYHGSFEELNREYYLGEKVKKQLFEKMDMKITPTGEVVGTKTLGANGNIVKVAKYTADISWRETTKPHGIIAEKRYQEYLRNLPKGPTEAELRAVQQKKNDEELWRLIKDGRDPEMIDGIKVRKKGWRDQSDADVQLAFAHAKLEEQKALQAHEDAIRLNNFAAQRKLSTRPEHAKSLSNWHKGINYPMDLALGFPHGLDDINTRPRETTIDLDVPFVKYDDNKFKSDAYVVKDGNGDFEAAFRAYFNDKCFARACAYLEEVKKKKKEAEKARRKEEKRQLRLSFSTAAGNLGGILGGGGGIIPFGGAPGGGNVDKATDEHIPGDGTAPGIADDSDINHGEHKHRQHPKHDHHHKSDGEGHAADNNPNDNHKEEMLPPVVRMITGNALEDEDDSAGGEAVGGDRDRPVGVGEHVFSTSAGGSYLSGPGTGTGTGTAPPTTKSKSKSKTHSHLQLPPLKGIMEHPSLEQPSVTSVQSAVSFAASVSMKDENDSITFQLDKNAVPLPSIPTTTAAATTTGNRRFSIDHSLEGGDLGGEPSVGDLSVITGIGGNTMSKIPGTGVRPGSALRIGIGTAPKLGPPGASGTAALGIAAVPALTLPPLGLPETAEYAPVPNTNGVNVSFGPPAEQTGSSTGACTVQVNTHLNHGGLDPGADPFKAPPPLRKRMRKAIKSGLKTAGSHTRRFFRLIRKGIRHTYQVVSTHGPVLAEAAFNNTCHAAAVSYVFIRDNTVGVPIKPKKVYQPLPKGQHWNAIPRAARPKIIPEMTKQEARRASMTSIKSQKLAAAAAAEEVDDEEGAKQGSKSRGGRRGSTDSGMISIDSSVATMDSDDSDNDSAVATAADAARKRKGGRKRQTRRKKPLLIRIFTAMYETVFGRPPPKESLMEKRAKEKEKQDNIKLKETSANKAAMDLIFRQRAAQRKSEAFYQYYFGVSSDKDNVTYTVNSLINATRRAQYNAILDILDGGFDSISPNDKNDDGESAFYIALMMVLSNEQNESAESELKDDLGLLDRIRLKFGRSAKQMQLDLIVNIFLFKGGDVNFIRVDKATDGRAVMHEAAQNGSVEMLKWLVSKKADINIRSTVRQSTPLMLAAAGGHIDAMMFLLSKGAVAHVNDLDNKGMSALHYTAVFGAPEHADILMICGADKNIRSKLNRLPLEEAKSRNRGEMVLRIQLYKPPFSMRQERMAYFEKIYGYDELDNDNDNNNNDTATVNS